MWVTLIASLHCNVLLGNLGTWNLCGCHLTCTTHPRTIAAQVQPLMVTTPPDGSGPPAEQCFPDTLQKLLRNGVRSTTKSPRCWPGLQIHQIPIQSSICGTWWNKSDPWKRDPKDPIQAARCQTPQDTPRGLMTMPRQVRAVLAA